MVARSVSIKAAARQSRAPSLPVARKSLWFSPDEMRRPAFRTALKPGAVEAAPACVPPAPQKPSQ